MFRVNWLQSALDELARIWAQADSKTRQAVTAAAHQIDQLLAADPDRIGESRSRGTRFHFVPPLGVVYQVDPQRRLVTVARVHLVRKRR